MLAQRKNIKVDKCIEKNMLILYVFFILWYFISITPLLESQQSIYFPSPSFLEILSIFVSILKINWLLFLSPLYLDLYSHLDWNMSIFIIPYCIVSSSLPSIFCEVLAVLAFCVICHEEFYGFYVLIMHLGHYHISPFWLL